MLYMPTTLPGIPAREAGWILQQMDRKLKAFPEVERVFGKLGRADTATDSSPVTMIETTVLLRPKSKWRKGMTKAKLVAEMDAVTAGDRLRQQLDPADQHARPDAGHGHPDCRGHQGKGAGGRPLSKPCHGGSKSCCASFPAQPRCIAERISEGYFVDVRTDLKGWQITG